MSGRVLELSLLAYPRRVRQRDGEHLLALAQELAEDHGAAREALGLLLGGLAERRHRRTPRAVIAVSAAAGSLLLALTWTAAAHPLRFEEDQLSCTRDCGPVEAQVAERERAGWTCTEPTVAPTVTWRCTRD
jgi:hypothetical protein